MRVGFVCAILYDVYAALGRLYETASVRFGYSAELEKIAEKTVDFFSCFVYINITKRNEHELVK